MQFPHVVTFTPVLDTNAYADNDVMFVPIEVTGVFRYANEAKALHSIVVSDGDDQGVDFDLLFFNASVTLGTINGAVNISDADAAKCLGHVSITATAHGCDLINSQLYSVKGIGLTVKAAESTSIWVGGVVRSGTPTYSASGMKIKLAFI